jgi:hypothetical protein
MLERITTTAGVVNDSNRSGGVLATAVASKALVSRRFER